MKVHNSRTKLTTLTAAAFAAVVALTMASSAHAFCNSASNEASQDTDWTNKSFGLFTLGAPTTVNISGPSFVTGNAGIAEQGSVSLSGSSSISGTTFEGPGVTIKTSGSASATGAPQANLVGTFGGNPGDPVADALSYSAFSSGLTVTDPTTQINLSGGQSVTFTDAANPGGCNVIDVSLVSLSGSSSVKLIASNSASSFTINDTGKFTLSGSSKIMLGGTLTAGDVVYNITGKGDDINMSGSTQVTGIVLAPNRGLSIGPAVIVGEGIFGGQKVEIHSGGGILNHQ